MYPWLVKSESNLNLNGFKIYLVIALVTIYCFLQTFSVINSYQNDNTSSLLLVSEVKEKVSEFEPDFTNNLVYFVKELIVVLHSILGISFNCRIKAVTRLTFLLNIRPFLTQQTNLI